MIIFTIFTINVFTEVCHLYEKDSPFFSASHRSSSCMSLLFTCSHLHIFLHLVSPPCPLSPQWPLIWQLHVVVFKRWCLCPGIIDPISLYTKFDQHFFAMFPLSLLSNISVLDFICYLNFVNTPWKRYFSCL